MKLAGITRDTRDPPGGRIERDAAGFRQACLAGAKTIPAYLAFLAICHVAIGHVDYRFAVLGGLAAWLIVTLAMFLAPRWI